jgi:hypothetical protein
MAQGIKAGMSVRSPKIWGKELEKEGVAWTAAKWYMPTLSLVKVSAAQRTLVLARDHTKRCKDHLRVGEAKHIPALAESDGLGDQDDIVVESPTVESALPPILGHRRRSDHTYPIAIPSWKI